MNNEPIVRTVAPGMTNATPIDAKHYMAVDGQGMPHLVKNNGVPINLAKEPVILFRGRDQLALKVLEFYRELCHANGCTDFQLESMDCMIRRFKNFADNSPTMKQPGCTMGR